MDNLWMDTIKNQTQTPGFDLGILDMLLTAFGPRLRVNVFDFGAAVPQRVSLGNPLTV